MQTFILLRFPMLNDFHRHRIRQSESDEIDHTWLSEMRQIALITGHNCLPVKRHKLFRANKQHDGLR